MGRITVPCPVDGGNICILTEEGLKKLEGKVSDLWTKVNVPEGCSASGTAYLTSWLGETYAEFDFITKHPYVYIGDICYGVSNSDTVDHVLDDDSYDKTGVRAMRTGGDGVFIVDLEFNKKEKTAHDSNTGHA